MIVFFDPSTLNDEELQKRETELHRRIVLAAMYASGSLQQLQDMLALVQRERQERLARKIIETQMRMVPDIIDTDPIGGDRAEPEKQDKKAQKPAQPSVRVARSSTPVVPKDFNND